MESFEKGSKEFEFMGDFFKFCKKYYKVPPNGSHNEWWESMVNDSTELCKKYDNTDFVISLVLGFVDYAENVSKEKQKAVKGQYLNY